MNNLFNKKELIGFLMAGDPDLETTKQSIIAMDKAGAGMVELGIPFSDPIAESDVIQDSNMRALENETYLPNIFKMIEELRKETQIPVIFHTYMNPVFNYGYENFFKECSEKGIYGIVVPDLPFEEKGEIQEYADKYGVSIISFVVPTDEKRIKEIAKNAQGFIYFVASIGTEEEDKSHKAKAIIDIIKSVTDIPVAAGFSINTPEQANQYAKIADGIIIGNTIVKLIEQYGKNSPEHIYDYVKSMKDAIK